MKLKPGMREKPNGSIEYRLVIDGKRYSICAKSLKELNQKEQDLRVKIARNEYIKSSSCTFQDYSDAWIERKKAVTKPNTIRSYKITLNNHILPEIGKIRLSAIDSSALDSLRDDICRKSSANTANYALRITRMIISSAESESLLNAAFLSKVKYIKEKKDAVETIHRALTKEEQKIFFDEAKNSFLYELLLLMVATGMRPGEAAALTWKDIDHDKNVIKINKTSSRTEDHKFTVSNTPKTESSAREIPITTSAQKILDMQKQKMQDLGFYGPAKNIFLSINGRPVNTNSVGKTIILLENRLKEKGYNFEHFTAHGLRDTFATRFIENGGSMKTLQTILGHSSITMTMDLYAHVLPDTKKDEMERIEIPI